MAGSYAVLQHQNFRECSTIHAASARSTKPTGPVWALSRHSLRDHLTTAMRTECEFAAAAPWSALIAESIGCENWLV